MLDHKVFRYFVALVAFIIFSLQMCLAFQKYMDAPTMVAGSHRTFQSINNPLSLAICKTHQFAKDRANGFGYESIGDYMVGDIGNESLLSWTGSYGNLTAQDVFPELYLSINESLKVKGAATLSKKAMLPFGLCTIAKFMPENFSKKGTHKTSIFFEGEADGEYMVYVLDPSAALNYQLPVNQMTGDRPRISLKENKFSRKYYSIQLKEQRIELGGESCLTYPDQNGHETYGDCVDESNRKKVLPLLGCMLPWMSDQDQCQGYVERKPEHEDLVNWVDMIYEKATESESDSYIDGVNHNVNAEAALQGFHEVSSVTRIAAMMEFQKEYFDRLIELEVLHKDLLRKVNNSIPVPKEPVRPTQQREDALVFNFDLKSLEVSRI